MDSLELEKTKRLVHEARAGSRDAWDALFRAHREELARSLASKMRGRAAGRLDRSDLVQETMADAIRRFDEFEPRGEGSFRRWLAAILDNRVRMALRSARAVKRELAREVRLPSNDGAVGLAGGTVAQSTPSEGATVRERHAEIERALLELPDDQREVVRLVKLEVLSIAETAARMQRSENAVKKLLARALLGLRARLAQRGESGDWIA